jgi:IS5 family transposase
MQRQGSFAEAEYSAKKKQTRRDKFLAEMDRVVPWQRLVARFAPLYPKGERGRPPIGLERMLRIYFLQQWYGLADEALEDALYDSQSLRSFAGIALNREAVPDATTILHFRHWLERHELTKALFAEVNSLLEERGLLLRHGTIVEPTILAAPPSTKNKAKARDPEMHQTKKGNQWHFGMKAHIGVDVASGLVHTLTGTAPTRPISTRPRCSCTGTRKRCSPMPATPGRTSGSTWPTARCRGTSRSSAASSRPCQKRCGIWPSQSSGRAGRASLPRGQEPLQFPQASLPRPHQKHRPALQPVRPSQSSDRQEGAARTGTGLRTPGSLPSPRIQQRNIKAGPPISALVAEFLRPPQPNSSSADQAAADPSVVQRFPRTQ